jgi:hypothetical protein
MAKAKGKKAPVQAPPVVKKTTIREQFGGKSVSLSGGDIALIAIGIAAVAALMCGYAYLAYRFLTGGAALFMFGMEMIGWERYLVMLAATLVMCVGAKIVWDMIFTRAEQEATETDVTVNIKDEKGNTVHAVKGTRKAVPRGRPRHARAA